VVPEALVKGWIKVKKTFEIVPLLKKPHPYEYDPYHDP
jgi:hypothetical protein